MKFYPSGKFYIAKDAADKNPIIMKTGVFNLDIEEDCTIGAMKAALLPKLMDTNLYEKVKEELEVRGEKELPPDTAKVSDYKFFTYSVYGKEKPKSKN